MRSLFLVAVLVSVQVARGEEQPAANQSDAQSAKPAVVANPAPAATSEEGKQVVQKPAIADDKNSVQQAAAQQESPLHEHPTLLKMLFRNNELRGTRGLWAHRINPLLTKAAQDHAVYMARTRDFNHYSNLGPSGRAAKYGFRGGVLENIAWGYGDVDSTFSTWQHSGGHWANMTSSTTDAGFGFALAADGTPYWVAVYGTAPAEAGEGSDDEGAAAPAVNSGNQTYYGNSSRGRLWRRRG